MPKLSVHELSVKRRGLAFSVVCSLQRVGVLLESELQNLMLAQGTPEFALLTMGAVQQPDRRTGTTPALSAIAGTNAGGIVGLISIFVGQSLRPPGRSTIQ